MSDRQGMPAVVRFEDVSKRFRSYQPLKGGRSFKSAVVAKLNRRRASDAVPRFTVLRDVNLEVRSKDSLAILGPNGCGKSTLLKLVAGIYRPDVGRVKIRGRVASLLELGTGFHPDFTGRENIVVNASILGLDRAAIQQRIPTIVSFSGLADRIDAPVRTYSSGMHVRLAFSVAVHVVPDILLIDEVLAVGDQDFRDRCVAKIHELHDSGVTILFVSHEMGLVQELATRAVVISDGYVREAKDVREGIRTYIAQGTAHSWPSSAARGGASSER